MLISITLIIIIVTCAVSIPAFSNERLMDALIFDPPAITFRHQYYRFFTCGFIHANFLHLGLNMYTLYLFGQLTEVEFLRHFGTKGHWLYLLMYISSLFFCLLPTYSRNRENYNYRSLGASGAVSGVIFAFIFMQPLAGMGPIGLSSQLHIPAFVFGVLYLIISSILDRRGGGNINHSAHIFGALYGISFLIVAGSVLSYDNLLESFVRQVKGALHL